MPRIKKSKRSRSKRYVKKSRYSTKRRTARASKSWGSLANQTIKYGAPLVAGLAKLSGYGDYHSTAGAVTGGQIPIIQNTSGGCIVRHREYLGDLQGSQGFILESYNINPGNPKLFPWLSSVANNFEQWCPRGMIYINF